ncbi:MAG: aryl-sulfate sulfotransferase, partial [candidate division Zixibacteria bacterium]|nr:aryl-sulfate sulfotransferase [candidate division Zixibacteria bacterium]
MKLNIAQLFKMLFMLAVLSIGLSSGWLVSPLQAQEQTLGLFRYDSAAFDGYTLFAPLHSTTTFLIDMYGRRVHAWEAEYIPNGCAYLLENGHLMRSSRVVPGGGGLIREIDWDGTVLWEFNYFDSTVRQHHDFEVLPSGNVLLLAWEFKSKPEAIAAGRDSLLFESEIVEVWPEHVVEVEPIYPSGGNIVWEWHLWDHLIQDYDSTKANYGVVADHPELVDINFAISDGHDWLHANAVDYNPQLDQIIISCRQISQFWIIDHSTTTEEAASHSGGNSGMGGDILYRWGNPQGYDRGTEEDQKLYLQHDAQWITPGLQGEGRILLYNNGGKDRLHSTVDEIETTVDVNGHYPQPAPGEAHGPAAASWVYGADPADEFYSTILSGASRLANGNTLICAGIHGWFFEVTSDGEKVWEYINPVGVDGPGAQGDTVATNRVFRCFRYAPDYPGLQGRDLTPGGPLELYPTNIS